MPPTIQQILQQIKNMAISTHKYCDNCGHKHMDADFKFIDHQDPNMVFQISCSNCGVVYILKVNPSSPGAVMQQRYESVLADISANEFNKFAGKTKVAKEEALQVYMDMQKVKNISEFMKLFEKDRNTTNRLT